jgi:hypothetical protein
MKSEELLNVSASLDSLTLEILTPEGKLIRRVKNLGDRKQSEENFPISSQRLSKENQNSD